MTRILYLVHNLNDAAVDRRVRMLVTGGASVSLAGFWRGAVAPLEVAGVPCLGLGRTQDSRLGQRALLVARLSAWPSAALRRAAGSADVIVARNLEMLAIASRVLMPGQRLVYECLDIHRSMISDGFAGRGLRALERRLLRRAALLITSSPAFVREYFELRQRLATPWLLVENKWLELGHAIPDTPAAVPNGPPWTIGWFGNLRCRRSLDELAQVAARLHGRASILVAGRASPAEFPDFAAAADRDGIDYAGAYSADELPALYRRCHFAWCLDYFEEGLNSEWLLPNRLYEAISCGAVPLARTGTETAAWLQDRGVGLVLDRASAADDFAAHLEALSPDDFATLSAKIAAVPAQTVVAGEQDCSRLVRAIAG